MKLALFAVALSPVAFAEISQPEILGTGPRGRFVDASPVDPRYLATGDGKTWLPIGGLAVAVPAFAAVAMPTQAEFQKVLPLVREMSAEDVAAANKAFARAGAKRKLVEKRIRDLVPAKAAEPYPVPDGLPRFDRLTAHVDGLELPVGVARCSKVPFNRRWPGHQRPLEQTEICGVMTV